MLKLAEDQPLRSRMGAAARARAIEEFSEERLTTAFQNFYRKHGVLN
jgi:glycosyltransferase involved in cell wall biosynthesis